MGIDKVGMELIIMSHKHLPRENRNKAIALARQQIHIHPQTMDHLFQKYGINAPLHECGEYFEALFKDMGYVVTDSIDNSAYENATIIHNLNLPLRFQGNRQSEGLLPRENRYNYVFDGGTIEHIFNCPQVCENIIDMLEVGGIFCSLTANNNLSGHGIYQFSPEFFLSAFTPKYGMEVLELYLAEFNADRDQWIDVKSFNGWRNNAQINTQNSVYIVAIIRKISDDRESLLLNPPNQYSYENVDWNK
jgi:hypothetical protein